MKTIEQAIQEICERAEPVHRSKVREACENLVHGDGIVQMCSDDGRYVYDGEMEQSEGHTDFRITIVVETLAGTTREWLPCTESMWEEFAKLFQQHGKVFDPGQHAGGCFKMECQEKYRFSSKVAEYLCSPASSIGGSK